MSMLKSFFNPGLLVFADPSNYSVHWPSLIASIVFAGLSITLGKLHKKSGAKTINAFQELVFVTAAIFKYRRLKTETREKTWIGIDIDSTWTSFFSSLRQMITPDETHREAAKDSWHALRVAALDILLGGVSNDPLTKCLWMCRWLFLISFTQASMENLNYLMNLAGVVLAVIIGAIFALVWISYVIEFYLALIMSVLPEIKLPSTAGWYVVFNRDTGDWFISPLKYNDPGYTNYRRGQRISNKAIRHGVPFNPSTRGARF